MSRVLITGAAAGLGREMARVFAARGDELVLVDRDRDGLEACAAELDAAERVTTRVVDLTEPDAVSAVVGAFGHTPLDVLVNNAGITHRSPAVDTAPEVYRRVMQLDWQVPVELTLALLPQLRAGAGRIVNIGSMAGWMPVPGRAGYCSAKAALSQFFEVLRAEEADRDLHVLMVYPAFLETDIERNALGAGGEPAGHARSTVGRIRGADELAGQILRALENRRAVLFPDRFTWFASLLWRLAPGLFHKLVRRRFRVELEQRR